jgi:hypothetical protein
MSAMCFLKLKEEFFEGDLPHDKLNLILYGFGRGASTVNGVTPQTTVQTAGERDDRVDAARQAAQQSQQQQVQAQVQATPNAPGAPGPQGMAALRELTQTPGVPGQSVSIGMPMTPGAMTAQMANSQYNPMANGPYGMRSMNR